MGRSSRDSHLLMCALVSFVSTGVGCARQPCDTSGSEGLQVRLDVAVASCNAPPDIALTGRRVVSKGVAANLDAKSTRDPNDDPVSFTWKIRKAPDGSSAELVGPTSPTVSLTPDLAGKYTVEVSVSDGELTSTKSIDLIASNDAPVAFAGDDRSEAFGAEVVLDGSASSDPNGDDLRYTWSIMAQPQGSVATLDLTGSADGRVARILPDVRGPYEFQLLVTDGELMAVDTVVIVAGVSASPPVARAGPDRAVSFSSTVTLDGTRSSDPDGDPITYEWQLTDKPASSSTILLDDRVASPQVYLDVVGDYTFTLVVRDAYFTSPVDSVTLTATPPPLGTGITEPCLRGGNAMVLSGQPATPDRRGDPIHPFYREYRGESVFTGEPRSKGNPFVYRVTVSVDATQMENGTSFQMDLFGPTVPQLGPPTVRRYDPNDPATGSFEINGYARGCSVTTGTFEIHDLDIDDVPGGYFLRNFTVSFEQHCDNADGGLFGCIHYSE